MQQLKSQAENNSDAEQKLQVWDPRETSDRCHPGKHPPYRPWCFPDPTITTRVGVFCQVAERRIEELEAQDASFLSLRCCSYPLRNFLRNIFWMPFGGLAIAFGCVFFEGRVSLHPGIVNRRLNPNMMLPWVPCVRPTCNCRRISHYQPNILKKRPGGQIRFIPGWIGPQEFGLSCCAATGTWGKILTCCLGSRVCFVKLQTRIGSQSCFISSRLNFFYVVAFTQISDRTGSDVNPAPKAERLLAEKDEVQDVNMMTFSRLKISQTTEHSPVKAFSLLGQSFLLFLSFSCRTTTTTTRLLLLLLVVLVLVLVLVH